MAYMGFKKLKSKLESEGKSPKAAGAIAASVGRKKYGAKKFNKAAAEGKSLRGAAAKRIKNKMDYSKQNVSYS
jgi:hypothetical protein|tara:strand:+ start:4134 stop:4352 length:219 start_codon:yes stop_codon:yes gene_type:complete